MPNLALENVVFVSLKRNLELCFPNYTHEQIEQILAKNIESVGMAIIETGMAWFWSDKRILKWSKVEGIEHLKNVPENSGILFCWRAFFNP